MTEPTNLLTVMKPAQPTRVEVRMADGQWVEVEKHSDVPPGWLKFVFPDGRMGLATPDGWRNKT